MPTTSTWRRKDHVYMTDLVEHSIDIIRTHQAESGAYVACPNMPAYRYSWFRDGAFIAYAMSIVGEHDSAHRFHDWVANTILAHRETVERAIAHSRAGIPLGDDYLDTRYTVDGERGDDEWPNFQLDGLGTWLWALAEHIQRTDDTLADEWHHAAELVVRYLRILWKMPCYDLWEEFREYLHPYTLAAIYAGFVAAADLLPAHRASLLETAEEIKQFVTEHALYDGHIAKSIAPSTETSCQLTSLVDASLVGLATPYQLFSHDDPVMQATVARIEADLHRENGGVYRYINDTYYGGGEWVLLAAWLGWYYAEAGTHDRAHELLHWVQKQADDAGNLPEQVPHTLLYDDYYPAWVDQRGEIATPLLWSHAMYLIVVQVVHGHT